MAGHTKSHFNVIPKGQVTHMKAKNNENILGFYEVTQGPDKTRPTHKPTNDFL